MSEPLPQMQFRELVKFYANGKLKAHFFDKFSGGELNFAVGQYKRWGTRMNRPVSGRGSLSEISLERTYVPNDATLARLWEELTDHLQDPSNSLQIKRVMRDRSQGVAGAVVTEVIYRGVTLVGANFGDGDITSDDGMVLEQLKFAPTHKRIERNGVKISDTETDLDVIAG